MQTFHCSRPYHSLQRSVPEYARFCVAPSLLGPRLAERLLKGLDCTRVRRFCRFYIRDLLRLCKAITLNECASARCHAVETPSTAAFPMYCTTAPAGSSAILWKGHTLGNNLRPGCPNRRLMLLPLSRFATVPAKLSAIDKPHRIAYSLCLHPTVLSHALQILMEFQPRTLSNEMLSRRA
jgi:hypothetical protein